MIKIVNFMSGMFYHNRKKKGMDGQIEEGSGTLLKSMGEAKVKLLSQHILYRC